MDVQFETIQAEEIKFGNNNFIEVARKKAITGEGENEFVAVSRGFFAPDGTKRFKKSFTIPDAPEVVDFICSNIKAMAAGVTNTAPAKPAPAAEEAPAVEEAEEEQPAE
ncbi:MAG: hypothetical protein ABIG20_01310 [archaeon]